MKIHRPGLRSHRLISKKGVTAMEMEKLQLFAVLDCKMELYLQPITARNIAVAVRIFETAVLTPGHDFNQHADDYSLWLIGEFDQVSAELKGQAAKVVVQGNHIMNKYKNEERISGSA